MNAPVYRIIFVLLVIWGPATQTWAGQTGSPESTLAEIAKQDPSTLSNARFEEATQILAKLAADEAIPRPVRYEAAKRLYWFWAVGKPALSKEVINAARETVSLAESASQIAESQIALAQELINRFPADEIEAAEVKSAYTDAVKQANAYRRYAEDVRKDPARSLPVVEIDGKKAIVLPALNRFDSQQWSLAKSFTSFLVRQGNKEEASNLVQDFIQSLTVESASDEEQKQLLTYFEIEAYRLALGDQDWSKAIGWLAKLSGQLKGSKNAQILTEMGRSLDRTIARSEEMNVAKLTELERTLIEANLPQLILPLWLEYVQRLNTDKSYKEVEKLSKELLARLETMKPGEQAAGVPYFPDEASLALMKYDFLKLLNASLTGQERFVEARAVDLVSKKLTEKYKLDIKENENK